MRIRISGVSSFSVHPYIYSSPCLADTTNHEKGPGMARLLDIVGPRHLAAWRSSFLGAAGATASPIYSLILPLNRQPRFSSSRPNLTTPQTRLKRTHVILN